MSHLDNYQSEKMSPQWDLLEIYLRDLLVLLLAESVSNRHTGSEGLFFRDRGLVERFQELVSEQELR